MMQSRRGLKGQKQKAKTKIRNQSIAPVFWSLVFSYLIVEKEVNGGYENTLKRVEEMRCDGPNCKTQPRAAQWIGPYKMQHIGDTQ